MWAGWETGSVVLWLQLSSEAGYEKESETRRNLNQSERVKEKSTFRKTPERQNCPELPVNSNMQEQAVRRFPSLPAQ